MLETCEKCLLCLCLCCVYVASNWWSVCPSIWMCLTSLIYRRPSMLACVNVCDLIVIYRRMQAIQTAIWQLVKFCVSGFDYLSDCSDQLSLAILFKWSISFTPWVLQLNHCSMPYFLLLVTQTSKKNYTACAGVAGPSGAHILPSFVCV